MSIFKQQVHRLIQLPKDENYSIKKEIKRIGRKLFKIRERTEFQYSSIEAHFKLSNMEECQDALNKLLYLYNREINSRKRRYFHNIAHRGLESDRFFYMNVPYDEVPRKTRINKNIKKIERLLKKYK